MPILRWGKPIKASEIYTRVFEIFSWLDKFSGTRTKRVTAGYDLRGVVVKPHGRR
jgi:hypothetical protein